MPQKGQQISVVLFHTKKLNKQPNYFYMWQSIAYLPTIQVVGKHIYDSLA